MWTASEFVQISYKRGSGHGTTPAGGRAGAVRALDPGGREPSAFLDRGGPDTTSCTRFATQRNLAEAKRSRTARTTTRLAQSTVTSHRVLIVIDDDPFGGFLRPG